ncbi:MAG: glycogen synthase [Acidobacteria bacterium]|nr:glycogen synthase [Acidobacteriota bacterium]
MKTLFLTNEYPPHVYGGAGVHVEYLSRELARLIDVEVRCFGEQSRREGRLAVRGYQPGGGHFARTPATLKSPLEAFERCIAFAADPVDAQVVHCHTWYTHLGGVVVRRAYGIPLVITSHSLEPLRPWKREQLGLGFELSTWIEKTALEDADALVAVSHEMKRDIVRLFDVDESRVHVIHNGIDTDEYRPVAERDRLARFGLDDGREYVLFVGRITRQKGIIHLVEALAHLDPSIPVVLCAGAPDTPEIGAEMERKVDQARRRRGNVLWIREMVDRATAVQLYSHAAVFCCPSVYEPFGIINLEAMACATAVVASAVGGIPEIVVPEKTGLLVPVDFDPDALFRPRDPDAFARGLAAALARLMADRALRERMGRAGRERAVESFSWAAIARQTNDLYGRLTGRDS